MTIVLVDVECVVYFFFHLGRGCAEACSAAYLAFERGCVYGRMVARMGFDDNVGVCGFAVYPCREFAIVGASDINV